MEERRMVMEGGGGREAVRIFVGGLGESVSSDDIDKIFSPRGGVESVDIIRSKGRSFAYINFIPSSAKSLSTLFSTYNGCVWKGGRLRLEKAKEYFLSRLRREWEEAALLAASSETPTDVDVVPNKKMESSEKPKKELGLEKRQLRIFFPRLNKVKSIPFSGTGKHKYSFRRVEVPLLPTHFCDCEEHSGAFYASEEKKFSNLEEQGGGMDEEELNLMNSLMNELLKQENVSNTVSGEINLAKEGDNSIKAIDELHLDENKGDSAADLQLDENKGDSTADEDNLVLNIVSRGQKVILANQESSFNERLVPKDETAQSVPKMQRRNVSSPNKKRKAVHQKENNCNEYMPAIIGGKSHSLAHSSRPGSLLEYQFSEPESGVKNSTPRFSFSQKASWRELVGDRGNSVFNISDKVSGISSVVEEQSKFGNVTDYNEGESSKFLGHEKQKDQLGKSKVTEGAEARPTKPDSALSKNSRGSAWLQKSSWTQLIGGSKSSTFSIKQIMPGVTLEKKERAQPDSMRVPNSIDSKHCEIIEEGKCEGLVNDAIDLGVGKEIDKEMNQQILVANNKASTHVAEKKIDSAAKKLCTEDVAIGDTCSFMRTAASMKEWARAKAVIRGSNKRKSHEK